MLSHQTRIYAPDSYIKVRNLKIGTKVITMRDSKMKVAEVSEINKVYMTVDGLICLKFEGMDKPIYCSIEQNFFYEDMTKVNAEKLEIGDALRGLPAERFRLISKERIENQETKDKFHKEGPDYLLYNIRMSNEEDVFFLNSGIMSQALSYSNQKKHHVDHNYANYMENK